MPESTKRAPQDIATLVMKASEIINNASLPEISVHMKGAGYTDVSIAQAKKFLTTAEQALSSSKKELGEQMGATATADAARAESTRRYMRSLKLARVALVYDADASRALMLNGDRKASWAGWLDQCSTFYLNIFTKTEWLAEMASVGVSEDLLREDAMVFNEAKEAHLKQLRESGDYQMAVRKQDTALDNLFDWVNRYRGIAKVILGEYPDLVEKLGIVDRN